MQYSGGQLYFNKAPFMFYSENQSKSKDNKCFLLQGNTKEKPNMYL